MSYGYDDCSTDLLWSNNTVLHTVHMLQDKTKFKQNWIQQCCLSLNVLCPLTQIMCYQGYKRQRKFWIKLGWYHFKPSQYNIHDNVLSHKNVYEITVLYMQQYHLSAQLLLAPSKKIIDVIWNFCPGEQMSSFKLTSQLN